MSISIERMDQNIKIILPVDTGSIDLQNALSYLKHTEIVQHGKASVNNVQDLTKSVKSAMSPEVLGFSLIVFPPHNRTPPYTTMSSRFLFPLHVLILFLGGCTTLEISENQQDATLAISASSSSLGGKGSGIIVELTHLGIKEKVRSISLGKMSDHSVVLHVKEGTYLVTGIELPIGGLMFKNYGQEVARHFGPINVEAGKRYYLGNYAGKQKIGRKNTVSLTFVDSTVPDKLKRRFDESREVIGERTFIPLWPVEDGPLIIY